MLLILLLLALPLVGALAVGVCRRPGFHPVLMRVFSAAVALLSLGFLAPAFRGQIHLFPAHAPWLETLLPWLEGALGAYFIYIGLSSRRYLIALFAAAQTGLLLWLDFSGLHVEIAANLFVDRLSVLMALVVGVVGGLICLYSAGYMRRFHAHHSEVPDRSRFFSVVLLVFLSAMFGVVFSNNLLWLYFSWEITTLCSFLLIGYKQDARSRANSLHALELNLLGGVAFAVGLVCLARGSGILELDKLMHAPSAAILLPVALLSLAGLTKSAQFPFSSWLLGAMVAPTPVSALLHSSTMVKAGVYLVLRFAAPLSGTWAGFAVALIGALTFLFASFLAVGQSDAKKVLAYSTVANLGLIILCAGVGTSGALWAAELLIVFHALAKGLLFLCTGTAEHALHSRDIEDMSGLVVRLPGVAVAMQIGICGMFLAPFGMLISKWAVIESLVDYSPLLATFVIFGGAATLFYWVKWLGKLLIVTGAERPLPPDVGPSQWTALGSLAALTVLVCAIFPLLSAALIEPYVIEVFGRGVHLGRDSARIMAALIAFLMLFPLSFLFSGRGQKSADLYLAGANAGPEARFTGAAQTVRDMQMGNYYLSEWFGEEKLFRPGVVLSTITLFAMLALAF